jgi:hypothetical protein
VLLRNEGYRFGYPCVFHYHPGVHILISEVLDVEAVLAYIAAWSLGRSPKVAHDYFGFGHYGVDIVCPPLKHLLSLLRILGNDVNGADALRLMAESLLDHVSIETLLGE